MYLSRIRHTTGLLVMTFLASVGSPTAGGQNSPALTHGATPPAIKVEKWVKGEAVARFDKGTVYVVEFWDIPCLPCRAAMRHLTESASKHKDKVVVIGVCLRERDDGDPAGYADRVAAFVKAQGDRIGYRIAVDERTETMAKAWMDAAGKVSVPVSFVVGPDGRLAWVGNPLDGVGEMVDQVVAGTFDPKRAAARQKDVLDREKLIDALLSKKDLKEGLARVDALIRDYPAREYGWGTRRFELLLATDEQNAWPYARQLAAGAYKSDAARLRELSLMCYATSPLSAKPLQSPDLGLALKLAEQGAAACDHDPLLLDVLAFVQYKNGQQDKAIATQDKVVEKLRDLVRQKKASAETLRQAEKWLDGFRKGLRY